MRKIIVIFLAIFSFFLPFFTPFFSSFSEGELYMRVIDNNTPFFVSDSDESPLFYLPYTYYVRVLESAGDYVHVEYLSSPIPTLDGYVKSSLLFNDSECPENPYLVLNIKTTKNTVLYENTSLSSSLCYVFSDKELNFIGYNYDSLGNQLLFVNYNNKLGYIKASDIPPLDIENHPNPLTFIKEETKEEQPSTSKDDTSQTTSDNGIFTIRVIIIICIIFAVAVSLIVAFKKKPDRNSNNYYDENEYDQ